MQRPAVPKKKNNSSSKSLLEKIKENLIAVVAFLVIIPSVINALSDIWKAYNNTPLGFQERVNDAMWKKHFEQKYLYRQPVPVTYKGQHLQVLISIYDEADVLVDYGDRETWFPFDPTLFASQNLLINSAYAKEKIGVVEHDESVVETRQKYKSKIIRRRIFPDKTYEISIIDINSGLIEKRESKIFYQSIDEIFIGKNFTDYYSGEATQRRKEKNIRKSAKIPKEEKVLAVIDATVFGSAANGMAFTESGLYVHNDWGGHPAGNFYITYDRLSKRESSGDPAFEVWITDDHYFNVAGNSTGKYEIQSILEEIKLFVLYKDYLAKNKM